MSVDFEPVDVKQDLDLSDVVRTNIEGTSAADYDVEYGVLPINEGQLAAPTHNVGVPADGTLGYYETNGEGDSEQYEVSEATLKAGGKGYTKDAIADIKGISPADIPAKVKITSVEPSIYGVASATASGESMAGYAKNETITIAGASGDTSAVLTIGSVEPTVYHVATATAAGTMSGYVDGETITIEGAEGDIPAVLTLTVAEGAITALTVTNAGLFASDIAGTVSTFVYEGQGTGLELSVTTAANANAGAIKTLTVTTAGEFASDIAGAVPAGKITYSGSGTGATISVTTSVLNSDAGEILSIQLVSAGSYCKELDGDVDVIAGSGTGGKVTVDMAKIEPAE